MNLTSLSGSDVERCVITRKSLLSFRHASGKFKRSQFVLSTQDDKTQVVRVALKYPIERC
jgi:hypothetical protein